MSAVDVDAARATGLPGSMSLHALLWLLGSGAVVAGAALWWHRTRVTVESLRRAGHKVEPADGGGFIVDGDLHLTEGNGWIFRVAWEAAPSSCFGLHGQRGLVFERRTTIVHGGVILYADDDNEAVRLALRDAGFGKTLGALSSLGLIRLVVSETELLVQLRPSRLLVSRVVPWLRQLEADLTRLEQPRVLPATASSIGGSTSAAAPALFRDR